MGLSANRLPPALKHGAYSAMTVMPTEDPREFDKLHQQLIEEWLPSGALEEDIVATMARLMWRKHNLATLQVAERVQNKLERIRYGYDKPVSDEEQEAREEFGHFGELADLGTDGTMHGLSKALDLIERLDGQIDRCLKRLLMARGAKSMFAQNASVKPLQALPAK